MRRTFSRADVPLTATALVCAAMYLACGLRHRHFFSLTVLVNLLCDNAFLGLAAVGLTFVILCGGIDLAVGAMIGFSSILLATLITQAGWPVVAAMLTVLLLGTVYGALAGGLIQRFGLPPFLVTLAGMFLLRGAGFVINLQSISIDHPLYYRLGAAAPAGLPIHAVVFLAAVVASAYVLRFTPFGRMVYAVGGSASAALLMGLPVGRVRIAVYAISGACSAGAGIVYTLYTFSGNANAGMGLELDAIATVVIGGTLLSGGVGSVLGTLIGVLIYGMIQTAIAFEGTLSSWWTKIAVGGLLLVFVLLQRVVQRGAGGAPARR
jgi:ribose/xylose/arabinose/galactoside ABC-type transport system permease subunit